jgi:hypothetical protein
MATCVAIHGRLMFVVSTVQSVSIDGKPNVHTSHMVGGNNFSFFQSRLRNILGLEFL